MDANIKVLIVDDHKLISEAWSSLLKDAPDIFVVGTADNVDDAYNMSLQHKPEIVLMDINLGAGSGFDATEKLIIAFQKQGLSDCHYTMISLTLKSFYLLVLRDI